MNFGTQKAESWMSFWGGYLGAFVGLLAVIYTTNKQIQNSKSLMIDQIKEQTKQIKLSAKIHDGLERKRIYLNTILEKTLEFQQFTRELENRFYKHSKISIELLNEKKELYSNLLLSEREKKKFKRIRDKAGQEIAARHLRQEEKIIQDKINKHNDLTELLMESEENVKNILNAVHAYKVFLEIENNENEVYINDLENLLTEINNFLKYSGDFIKINIHSFSMELDESEKISDKINEFNNLRRYLSSLFKAFSEQSGSHIKFILEKIDD